MVSGGSWYWLLLGKPLKSETAEGNRKYECWGEGGSGNSQRVGDKLVKTERSKQTEWISQE